MLNLIGNSCAASAITKYKLNSNFINPFCYNVIDFNSMKNLIEYFNEIDFMNFKLEKDKNWNFSIIIDNKVRVQYVHYKFSQTKDFYINNTTHNIESKKIWEYIVNKYTARLSRMHEIPPVFIVASVYPGDNYYSDNELLELLNIKNDAKIIVASKNKLNFISNNSREYIHIKENFTDNSIPLADYIWDNSKLIHYLNTN